MNNEKTSLKNYPLITLMTTTNFRLKEVKELSANRCDEPLPCFVVICTKKKT